MPFMSGWFGERRDGGFVARRVGELSEYQRSNGCLASVRARDEGELWLLCDAQNRLSERVALAEALGRRQ
ncbi:hypothetical protein ACFOY4_31870 [Actinomadura syzygii]|uniref:Uncharacterized protein n=2 Tax=Actinomadura syzygii TaxID=1427538 RepID=A0A5D0UAZ9_9ACTN|nr:hypothetical protein [Actinomadura syzygii]TYC15277.1 hypothetical protein FXF65_14490 [Actinomadura syzygii]